MINILQLFTLPATNFTVQVSNETCSNNNDGKITLTAVQALNYKATLTINGVSTLYPFTSNLQIPSLNAGVYNLCISVVGQSSYQQCFDLTVTEPKPLSVYTVTIVKDRNITINLGGASFYQVQLNDKVFTTTANSITLPLANGLNNLLVSTDKSCQGVYKKTFFFDGAKFAYPNPCESLLNIDMGTDSSKIAGIKLYSVTGTICYVKDFSVDNGSIQVDLSALQCGTYVVAVKTDLGVSSIKIIKK